MAKLTPEAFFSILRDLGYGGGCSGVLATQEITSVAPLELILIDQRMINCRKSYTLLFDVLAKGFPDTDFIDP